MSVAAPVFFAAGYDIGDTVLAMGLMGDAGYAAEVSATSMKTGISRLIGPTKAGALALRSMGFGSDDTAEKEAKLAEAQKKLEEKSATLNAKQLKYNETLQKYGKNSSQAASAQASLIKTQNEFENTQSAVNLLTEEAAQGTTAYSELMIDEKGNMRPFVEALKNLQSHFSKLSKAEQILSAKAIFGQNQYAPWLSLMNTATDRTDKLNSYIRNCSGLTQEMADTMMGGFGGGIEKLKSSVDVLIYSIGETVAPTLQKVVDFVQEITDKLNAMSPATKETILKIALISAAIPPLLIIIGKVISVIGSLMKMISTIPAMITKLKNGLTVIKTAISGISAPVVAIIAVIALLVGAFVHLWTTNEEFRNNIIAIWEQIKTTFSGFIQGIVDRINALGFNFKDISEIIHTAWEGLCSVLAPIFEGAFQLISDIFKVVTDTLLGLLDVFIGFFTGNWSLVWNGIKEIFTGIWDFIKNFFSDILDTLKGIADVFLGLFDTSWNEVWTSVKNFFSDIWNSISAFFSVILNTIWGVVSTAWENIKTTISTVLDGIKFIIWRCGQNFNNKPVLFFKIDST